MVKQLDPFFPESTCAVAILFSGKAPVALIAVWLTEVHMNFAPTGSWNQKVNSRGFPESPEALLRHHAKCKFTFLEQGRTCMECCASLFLLKDVTIKGYLNQTTSSGSRLIMCFLNL